jgi:hypothetical protein
VTASSAIAALKVYKHPRKAAAEIAVRRLRVVAARSGLIENYDAAAEQRRIDELEAAMREATRCIRCGVALEDPESVERGIGPDCWAREQEQARAIEGPPATEGATP